MATAPAAFAQGKVPAKPPIVAEQAVANNSAPELDMMITGSTGGETAYPAGPGGSRLDHICDQACQLERLNSWRDLTAD